MPEAFTYFDMQRMIAAQVPSGVYYLEVHWRWHRKDNKTIRDQQLLPPLASTRTDGTSVYKAFDFKGSDVKFWGKALGTPIGNNRWFRVQFALHGHALPITRAEYEDMVKNWEALPTATTATLPGITTIAAAIVGEDMCVIFVDRNRLMTLTVTSTVTADGIWYDTSLAPCPIQCPMQFQENLTKSRALRARTTPIYQEMTSPTKNNYWNGIGTSHVVEILHRALIHPETKTCEIFGAKELRDRYFFLFNSLIECNLTER